MKVCKRCFKEFEVDVVDVSPATELADIFLRYIGVEDINDFCTQCREELGVMDLLGFGLCGLFFTKPSANMEKGILDALVKSLSFPRRRESRSV